MPSVTNNNIPKSFMLSSKPVVLWIHELGAIYNHEAIVNPDIFSNFRDGQLLRIHCPRNNIPQQQQQQQQKQQQKPQQPLPPQPQPQPQQSNSSKQEPDHSGTQSSSQSQQNLQSEQAKSSNDNNVSVDLQLDSVIVKGHAIDKENLAKQQQLQVSISKEIADRFNLRSRQEVYIELIEPFQVALDHVEIAFKEQYLGRSDMWRLQQYLKKTCVYYEKKILFAGSIKATIKRLFVNDEQVASGYITKSTRVVFRSASAKFFLFIQMSKEMWEFDEDGELYFEKAISNFLPHLFNRWKEEGANHIVSIVLFTRVYYKTKTEDPLVLQASDGRFYKDFYKVVADWETTDDWMSVIGILKQEQLTFQPNVLLMSENGRTLVQGHISTSAEGNILETINLALNPFDKHYVDRDLMRTGLSLILITPGVGKFLVNKKLLRLTNERMTDNGIAMDLVCLSPSPLHITPLMCYMDAPLSENSENLPTTTATEKTTHRGAFSKTPFMGNSPDKTPNNSNSYHIIDPLYTDSNDAPTQVYYVVPHWLDCSFYHHETGRFIRQDKFKTRCKMYEIQMMGIMEHDICSNSVPFLKTEEKANERALRTIKPQRSSSSLNDKIRNSDENKQAYYLKANGEAYLSTSASYIRRSSVAAQMEMTKSNTNSSEKLADNYKDYDNRVFKTSSESRFGRRIIPPTSTKSGKIISSARNSFDGIERPETNNSSDISNQRHKSTWQGDQRRIPSMTSYSQHSGIKGHFEHRNKEDKNIADPFKGSPTHSKEDINSQYRIIRRGTGNSGEGKNAYNASSSNTQQYSTRSHDDDFTISSSTIDPVPINTKFRSDTTRKTLSQSPHQAGSITSIHRQSENSDLMRTSFGTTNRSSPCHNYSRNNFLKHILINPCDPSDNQDLFTSHLRSWKHALPIPKQCEDPAVHWTSLTTPACLPLTTDYFPSNEELSSLYDHYMYTVSASEDSNLYQAGDRSLSEHVKTKLLLIEMLSQRLAQGFQIIVDDSTHIYYPKTALSKRDSIHSNLGKGIVNSIKESATNFNRKDDHGFASKRAGYSSNNFISNLSNSIALAADTNNMASRVDTTTQLEKQKDKWKNMVWWLSMGHQVHQLTFDSSGQNVEVRRFVKITKFDISKIEYKCAIWPKNMTEYRPKNLGFGYPSLHYQWNYLDHLVAGYQDELTDNLRFWRARFIAIPRETLPNNITLTNALHENLDEEEKRIALFESWIQNIRKAKWIAPEERDELKKRRKREIGFSDLGITHTTMDPSAYVSSNALKLSAITPVPEPKPYGSLLSSINISQTLTLESKTKDIAIAMQDIKAGLKIMDRYWHLHVYHDVFIGTEFVDWLIHQFEDITTREKAVKFGNSLMQRTPPLFFSATKRHGFLDGNYYYGLHEEFVVDNSKKKSQQKSRKAYGGNDSGTNSAVSTPSKEKEFMHNDIPSGASLHQIPSSQSNISYKSALDFQMSQSVIIDVDPYKKSNRRETAILHYDTIHNPSNCYHFQLNWLGCTAQLVQELVQNWSRQAERCGLKLVEGSVDQAFDDSENNNPFQCPVPITMSVPPPPVAELVEATKINVPDQFYEIALARRFDFVLDVEADRSFERAKSEGVELEYTYIKEDFKYDQYIHQSGVSFIQIRPDGKGFYWVNNRLYTNHTPAFLVANRRQSTSHLCHPDALRTQFEEKCSDPLWLTEFWESTRSRFLTARHDSLDAWVFENSEAVDNSHVHQLTETTFSAHRTTLMSPSSPSPNTQLLSSSSSLTNSTVTDITESINALKK